MFDPRNLVPSPTAIGIAIAVVVATAILAVTITVWSCVQKPDPYQLKINDKDGFKLVVPQD